MCGCRRNAELLPPEDLFVPNPLAASPTPHPSDVHYHGVPATTSPGGHEVVIPQTSTQAPSAGRNTLLALIHLSLTTAPQGGRDCVDLCWTQEILNNYLLNQQFQ